jgi:hypothetical protein
MERHMYLELEDISFKSKNTLYCTYKESSMALLQLRLDTVEDIGRTTTDAREHNTKAH